MLRRLPLVTLGAAIALAACTQTPSPLNPAHPASGPYRVQQADSEGANDASLDAIIRELDAEGGGGQAATESAVPMQSQMSRRFFAQQAGDPDQDRDRMRDRDQDRDRDRGYGWYGGYGYGPYGYGIFARCQRIYQRCLSRSYLYYSGPNSYQFCRRIRNRCVSAQWIR
ncbi:MAG TPA: hypothetical protein V6D05_08790 [Stenomitos sp.]